MLLNIIKEEDNTSKIVYFVLPTDNSLTTNNDIIRTAYYYRTTVFKVPQCHVGYCNGVTDIHRIMWLIHTTFVDVEAVVIVKPSTVINPPKRILIEEIVDKVLLTDWGIIKSEHNQFFVLNARFSHVYKSNKINDIVKCCEANKLDVINNDELDYNEEAMDLNHKAWSWKDFDPEALETKLPLRSNNKINLTKYQTKNVVYYKSYEDDIKPFLDKFENSATFSNVDELKERLDEFTGDTTWILGNFFVCWLQYFTMSFNQLESVIANLLAVPDSLVWAKLYHTTDEIHSTLKIHNLYKGPTV